MAEGVGMLAKSYLDFKGRLDEQGAVLTYCGGVSEAIMAALGETLKQKMAERDTDAAVVKRAFSIFIEQVQNVIRYSEERDDPGAVAPHLGAGLIMVGMEDGRYFIVCGNFVQPDRVERLKARLDHLVTLDKDSIRQFYREKLREPPEEGSLGATIGLIEIARRSSLPIEYDFSPSDAGASFFCLKAYV
jgi:Family of unknown function (DUF6272)